MLDTCGLAWPICGVYSICVYGSEHVCFVVCSIHVHGGENVSMEY